MLLQAHSPSRLRAGLQGASIPGRDHGYTCDLEPTGQPRPCQDESTSQSVDGFVKSPSAALRFIFRHCSVLLCTPHSSSEFILSLSKDAPPQTGFRKAQLASGACAVHLGDFLRGHQSVPSRAREETSESSPRGLSRLGHGFLRPLWLQRRTALPVEWQKKPPSAGALEPMGAWGTR